MKLKVRTARPYRRKDGSWDIKDTYEEIEIPDENMNRHSILCARCGFNGYPECREWCPTGKEQNVEAET